MYLDHYYEYCAKELKEVCLSAFLCVYQAFGNKRLLLGVMEYIRRLVLHSSKRR